jgi:lipopolysaccharide export system protein LptC
MLGRFAPATTLFPLILLGLLAGMTYWLEMASRPPSGANDGKSRHDPDYLIENFHVQRFGPEGALQHTLHASLMRHYPDDDSTVVISPDLTYHRIPPTRVTAREARLDSGAKHVELIDNVRVTRGSVAGKPETVLTTTRLDAWPDEETAATKEPVTITQGQSNVHGSGLQADNKIATYVLEGPVHGIFHRNPGAAPAVEKPAAAPVKAVVAPQPAPKPKASAKPQPKPKPKPKPKKRTPPKSKPKANSPTKR